LLTSFYLSSCPMAKTYKANKRALVSEIRLPMRQRCYSLKAKKLVTLIPTPFEEISNRGWQDCVTLLEKMEWTTAMQSNLRDAVHRMVL